MNGAQSCIGKLLHSFNGYLKYTFGSSVEYFGTTTPLDTPPNTVRDVDVMVVFSEFRESHAVHMWRIIRRLGAEYNLLLDVRIYSRAQLPDIPIVNRYLLARFLEDLSGKNPFADTEVDPTELKLACIHRIREQKERIITMLPRIANSADHLRLVAQCVYDAIRAYLLYIDKPQASKERACVVFVELMPAFAEVKTIYEAYLDPGSVFDVSDFIVSSLALVRHLLYKTHSYELSNAVLLVNSPSTVLAHPKDDYLSYDQNMPLGLVCVASYLKSNGVSTEILDAYAENLGVLSTVDRIFSMERLPRLVGFNACSPNIHIVQNISRYIKRINPDIIVFCGGPHATLAPQHTLSTGDINFAVAGEGERPALAIAQTVRAGGPICEANIHGVFFLLDGKTAGSDPERLEDLAVLPTPDFNLLPLHRYFSVNRRLYVHTTRGCAFKCVYCSVPSSFGKPVGVIPIDVIESHLREYERSHRPEQIQIVDDNFSHGKGELIRRFCKMVIANNFSFKWKCQARADQLTPETITLMKEARCFEIDLGIESGNAEIQKYIRKQLDLTRTTEVVGKIHERGMVAKAFFMLGFPNETYKQLADTINYAIRLKAKGLTDVAFFPVMPFPGTEISLLTGVVVHQGAIIDELRCYERSFVSHRLRKYSAKPEVSLNQRFNADHLRLLVKFAYVRFEAAQCVCHLESEFANFVAQEEAELYAY